ncbi:zinc ribbon domain-containing protein [Paenibacillus mesotrionivorans]|uniref:Zinc ribbon domain-containing protein n=1 Tax=Paenibacillus mesotrionivorans TaxID=3160968 RepID=A0ACC7NXF3_9BACL
MECPWCYKEMEPVHDRCPHCKTAIFLPEEAVLEAESGELEGKETGEERDPTDRVEDIIASRFRCTKCGGRSSSIQEVAMTGTGLSKLLDIQHHHYLFVSCTDCGFVEIYDPNILRGKKSGELGSTLDFFFG